MNGIEALTNIAVMTQVDEDAEILFGILKEYKQLDCAYWTAQSQINALETELASIPGWIRKHISILRR